MSKYQLKPKRVPLSSLAEAYPIYKSVAEHIETKKPFNKPFERMVHAELIYYEESTYGKSAYLAVPDEDMKVLFGDNYTMLMSEKQEGLKHPLVRKSDVIVLEPNDVDGFFLQCKIDNDVNLDPTCLKSGDKIVANIKVNTYANYKPPGGTSALSGISCKASLITLPN